MELKHSCERQVFEIILSEEKTSDMRKATQALTLDQMKDRLFELKVNCPAFCKLVLLYSISFFSEIISSNISNYGLRDS